MINKHASINSNTIARLPLKATVNSEKQKRNQVMNGTGIHGLGGSDKFILILLDRA